MFGSLAHLVQTSAPLVEPKDVPPPTPVKFPHFHPQVKPGSSSAGTSVTAHSHPDDAKREHLVSFIQRSLQRPTDLKAAHFSALGLHIHPDAPLTDLIPDRESIPDFSQWDQLSRAEAEQANASTRRPLCNGNLSPGVQTYFESRNELSIDNNAAFRTVRSMSPEPGVRQARLGNCYEFFKQLEMMAGFWDDTSDPPASSESTDTGKTTGSNDILPPSHLHAQPPDANLDQAGLSATNTSSSSSEREAQQQKEDPSSTPNKTSTSSSKVTVRASAGAQMPPEFRHNITTAFVKLVSYDFGANVSPPRVEPRLHLASTPLTLTSSKVEVKPPPPSSPLNTVSTRIPRPIPTTKPSSPVPQIRRTYFPSGCIFLSRSPTTREAARMGLSDGPIAAVSARNVTNFATQADELVDFGREIVAALVTAQHRAREGKEEVRFGKEAWWATEKRWGGGEGGPVGKEAGESSGLGTSAAATGGLVGEKGDVRKEKAEAVGHGSASHTGGISSALSAMSPGESQGRGISLAISSGGLGMGMGMAGLSAKSISSPSSSGSSHKKAKKTMSIYDSYRMVRPPSSNWDKKVRYSAIGKVKGAGYDDVFVVSALYHHISIVRVRVPEKLLEVLDGGIHDANGRLGQRSGGEDVEMLDSDTTDTRGESGNAKKLKGVGRPWERLEMWRTKWFDLFLAEERIEAMKVIWAMMAWMMRKTEGDQEDADMKGK